MASINESADQPTAVQKLSGDQTFAGDISMPADRDTGWQSAYSLSAPGLRQALMSAALISQPLIGQPLLSQSSFSPDSRVPLILAVNENTISPGERTEVLAQTVPNDQKPGADPTAPAVIPEVARPEATKPEATIAGVTKPEAARPGATIPEATIPGATIPEPTTPGATNPGGDIHDLYRTVNPCNKLLTPDLAPEDLPKPLDRVQDKDPVLYNQIKKKVKDPRYIGQTGDITVSTHNKKGQVNGCTFIQNTPYWLAGDAAKSYLDTNAALEPEHKKIEVDSLNGAGRTLGQEEAIAWRNTGVHAKPGKSNHGFGRAIDLQDNPDGQAQPSDDPDIREALHANGFRQGDSHGPLKNDLHHWSYTGPGRATEGHAIVPKHHRQHNSQQ